MSAAEFDPDQSFEAKELAAHERAVAATLTSKEIKARRRRQGYVIADPLRVGTFFELAQHIETRNHAARLAAEDAEARRRLRRLRWQTWAPRYTRDKYDIVTRDPVKETPPGAAVADRDDEIVGGSGRDRLRPEFIKDGCHVDRQKKRPWVIGKSRIRPGDEDDRVLNLIREVFNLHSPWDGEGEEPIKQPVPAAYFKDAAAKADPPIIWRTMERRAFQHIGIKSAPAPGMGAGKVWIWPADDGPNRAPESDVWPDGKGGWTTTPPADDGAE